MSDANIVIYTDGACTGNPGPGGWASIVSLPDGTVKELGGGERATTNNRMEMTAALEALAAVQGTTSDSITLYTDSQYLIKGITEWIRGWRARGWRNAEGKDVANRDIWEALDHQIERLKPRKIDWKYVPGHSGYPGNERCDEIGVAFANGKGITLYDGPKAKYTVDLDRVPTDQPLKKQNSPYKKASSSSKSSSSSSYSNSSSSGTSATTYLSYVGGEVMRHASWAACERRVKGKSNARFKKTKSAHEERETLTSWGLDPSLYVRGD